MDIVTQHPQKINTRIVRSGPFVATYRGDTRLGRWPNIAAGQRAAKLALIKSTAEALYDETLARVTAQPELAEAVITGTVEYLQGQNTDLAMEVETWLVEQRGMVAMTVATKKYGYGDRGNLNDPVLWFQKAGQEPVYFEPNKRPRWITMDGWLDKKGYDPIEDGDYPGFKRVEVRANEIIRRFKRRKETRNV